MNTAPAPIIGHVAADCLYNLEAVRRYIGLGKHAIREARRQGLKVRKIGRREFILGKDLIEFVESSGKLVDAQGLTQ